jgi:hypothetical protein
MEIYLKIQIKDEEGFFVFILFTSLHHTHLTLRHMLCSLAPSPAAAAPFFDSVRVTGENETALSSLKLMYSAKFTRPD